MNAANDWSTISQDKLDALAASLMPIEMLKEKLIHNEKGNVMQVIENCETVVREDELLNGAVRLNRMTGRLEIQKDMGWSRAGPAVNDNDMNNILSYMARNYDLRADKSTLKTCFINYFTLYHCMNYERKKYDGDNE